jgi:nucleoside permease NupC
MYSPAHQLVMMTAFAPAVLNEFVAYLDLREMVDQQAISQRAEIIATYALCGFSNFSSMGVQIGTTVDMC